MTAKTLPQSHAPESERPLSDTATLSPRTVLVLAIACGMVVANLYYVQPLLVSIAQTFHTTSSVVGLLATGTQVGYAVGLLLVVPLGDLLDRRRLVLAILAASILALIVAALAPTLTILAVGALAVGLTSVAAQILIPFAATLASDSARGRVLGAIMTGLLLGVLLARTFAGLIGQVTGWRAVYGIAAALTLFLMGLLWRELPVVPPDVTLSYGKLLRSIGAIVRGERILRLRMAYGALVFAAFSVFWTSIAFLLAGSPYHFNDAIIGLFGLAGAAGALCASFVGRLTDRGLARQMTGACLGIIAIAFGLLALGGHILVALMLGVIALDLGVQGMQITNQSEIYRLAPNARSRVTAAYMTAYFLGGAFGSAVSALAFEHAGWLAVCLVGSGLMIVGIVIWLNEQRKLNHDGSRG